MTPPVRLYCHVLLLPLRDARTRTLGTPSVQAQALGWSAAGARCNLSGTYTREWAASARASRKPPTQSKPPRPAPRALAHPPWGACALHSRGWDAARWTMGRTHWTGDAVPQQQDVTSRALIAMAGWGRHGAIHPPGAAPCPLPLPLLALPKCKTPDGRLACGAWVLAVRSTVQRTAPACKAEHDVRGTCGPRMQHGAPAHARGTTAVVCSREARREARACVLAHREPEADVNARQLSSRPQSARRARAPTHGSR
jgi:hypothetical protein